MSSSSSPQGDRQLQMTARPLGRARGDPSIELQALGCLTARDQGAGQSSHDVEVFWREVESLAEEVESPFEIAGAGGPTALLEQKTDAPRHERAQQRITELDFAVAGRSEHLASLVELAQVAQHEPQLIPEQRRLGLDLESPAKPPRSFVELIQAQGRASPTRGRNRTVGA